MRNLGLPVVGDDFFTEIYVYEVLLMNAFNLSCNARRCCLKPMMSRKGGCSAVLLGLMKLQHE